MKYNSKHTIYINDKNNEVPSVTTVLKILNKPALLKWANYLGFNHCTIQEVLNKTSDIGIIIHQLIYSYLTNKYIVLITGRLVGKNTIKKILNSFFDWKSTHTISTIFAEKQLVIDLFGGTIDFYGNIDNKKTLLDFKTSKKIYSSMFLQLAAYCIMLEKKGYILEQVGIVLINEYGYDEKFLTRKELQKYIDTFNKLILFFHDWFNLNETDGWGDILE